jgi:hypothetical protein
VLRPLEDVITIAKARLKAAHVPGTTLNAEVDLVRVVEVDNGRSTDRVVFQVTLAELDY